MKLTKENYELIMFDLLEGNIPAEQEGAILDQIMQDEFLSREWELFKSTILLPDSEIIYQKKDELMKEESKVIKFPIWISVAIAASLVFAFFLFIPKNDPNSGEITTEEPALGEIPSKIQEVPTDVPALVDQGEEHNTNEQDKSPTSLLPASDSNIIVDELSEFVIELPESPKMNKKESVEFQFDELQDPRIYNVSDYLAVDGVTSSQVDRITGRTVNIISKLRKPSMSISPNWKERALTLEIETKGYHAMASVAPFKKKQ